MATERDVYYTNPNSPIRCVTLVDPPVQLLSINDLIVSVLLRERTHFTNYYPFLPGKTMPRPYVQEDMEVHLNKAAEEDKLELGLAMVMSGVRWTPGTLLAAIRGAYLTGKYRTLHWLIENGCPPIAECTRME
jgi:hypothetical protein